MTAVAGLYVALLLAYAGWEGQWEILAAALVSLFLLGWIIWLGEHDGRIW